MVSYRKWLDCLCAAVYSKDEFVTEKYVKTNNEYLRMWKLAAKKKKLYLENGEGDKKEFLNLYAKANQMLAEEYIGFAASVSEIEIFENADSTYIRSKRRENAKVLLGSLSKKATLMFINLSDVDCPLHVPIILESKKRTKIRSMLTQESIYCPCHWPIDEKYPYQGTPYHEKELSLICDQRYSKEDMVREVDVILTALEKEDKENE